MGYCYLLHFAKPISDKHTCQHYIGYTSRSLADRMLDHRRGIGARLTQVAIERGIAFECVRTWANVTRRDERKLKNKKNSPILCPVCQNKPIVCKIR